MSTAPRTDSELLNELEFHLQSLNHHVSHCTTCPPTATMGPGEHLFKVEKEVPLPSGMKGESGGQTTRTMVLFVHLPARFPLQPPVITTFGGFQVTKYTPPSVTEIESPNSSKAGQKCTVHFERQWSPASMTLGEEVSAAFTQLDVLWGSKASPVTNYSTLRSLADSLASTIKKAQFGGSGATTSPTSTSPPPPSSSDRLAKYVDVVDNPSTASEALLAEYQPAKDISSATDATLAQLTDALAKLESKQTALEDAKQRLRTNIKRAAFSRVSGAEEEDASIDAIDSWIGTNIKGPPITTTTSPTTINSPSSTSSSSHVQSTLALGKSDGLAKALKEECRVAFIKADEAKQTLVRSSALSDGSTDGRREFDAQLQAVLETSKAAHLLDLRRKIATTEKL